MENEERTCIECEHYTEEYECSKLFICRNFKRRSLDKIIDNMDCLPIEVMYAKEDDI